MNEKSIPKLATIPSVEEKKIKVSDTDLLVEELRRRIVSNLLPPGSRIQENQLAMEFSVSRSRVRDAFGILEERGLIDRIPNKGAVVMRLEADNLLALFDVREVLEALMVRLATENAKPGFWKELQTLFGPELEQSVAENDLEAYMSAISEFREHCISAADNNVLRGILDSIYDRVQGMTRRLVLVPGRAAEGFKQHQEILFAMQAGDGALAEQLKRDNIRSARKWFLRYKDFLL